MQNYESEKHPSPFINQSVQPVESLVVSPDNPPWNSLSAIGVWIASVLFIGFVPLFLVVPYLALYSKNFADAVQSDPTVILLSIVGIIPAHILTLALAWAVATQFNKFSFQAVFGWQSGGFAWWHYLIVLGGFFILAAGIGYFLPAQDNELLRILRSSRATVYVVAFIATFFAPVVEEVVYRGILYSAIQRSIGIGWAVFIVTALFAGVHFWQYWGSPGTIILISLLSLILTSIRVYTKNLLPCIILHTIFNGIQSLTLIFFEDLSAVSPKAEAFFHVLK